MAIGMTYDQYWYGDPLMVRAFYKAEKLKQKRKDEFAWMQGSYFYKAVETVLGNMFRKEGKAPLEYPARPFLYEEKPEPEETKEEQEMLWAKAWMTSFVQAGKHWGKGG